MLLSRLKDPAAPVTRRAVVLPTHLTIRESSGPAPDPRSRQWPGTSLP
jgi:LacI family transcriptional regulator, galactose operon repressor